MHLSCTGFESVWTLEIVPPAPIVRHEHAPARKFRLHITSLGFGSWAAGGPWQFGWSEQDDPASIAAIHRALELGVNWIDTAPVYGLGHSEEVVARALAEWKGARPFVLYQVRHALG